MERSFPSSSVPQVLVRLAQAGTQLAASQSVPVTKYIQPCSNQEKTMTHYYKVTVRRVRYTLFKDTLRQKSTTGKNSYYANQNQLQD